MVEESCEMNAFLRSKYLYPPVSILTQTHRFQQWDNSPVHVNDEAHLRVLSLSRNQGSSTCP